MLALRKNLGLCLSSVVVILALQTAFYFTAVSSSPSLEQKGIEITYNISKNAELKCTIKNLNNRRIIWRRMSESFPISVGGFKFHPNRKYRVKASGETSTLTIRRMQTSDAAEYKCEATGGYGPEETISITTENSRSQGYFLETNVTITGDFGDTVILPCHVENIQNREAVMWKDDRNQVISIRKKEFLGGRRMRVQHRTRTEWSLQIKNMKEEDLGFYTCVLNTDPVLTRTVELRHLEPANFAPVLMQDISQKLRVFAELGEDVTLNCSFRAYPPPEIIWYKRTKNQEAGKYVKTKVGKGTSYTMRSVQPSEAGDYVCIGDNGVGEPGKAKMLLIVNVPPTTTPGTTTKVVPTGPTAPHLYHVVSHMTKRRGDNAYLECIGVGQPRPTLEWRRYHTKLEDNHKYDVTSKMDGEHHSILGLEIRALVSKDYGEYECHGHNPLGLEKITFHIEKE